MIVVMLHVRAMMPVVPVVEHDCAAITHRSENWREAIGVGPVRLAERSGRLPVPTVPRYVNPVAVLVRHLRNSIG